MVDIQNPDGGVMQDIRFSLSKDINNLCKEKLIKIGYKITQEPKIGNYLILYLNAMKRIIDLRPRKVQLPKDFTIPIERLNGVRIFLRKVELGKNLNSYQSTHLKRIEFYDSFLNDFGFHHFHLGEKLQRHGKNKGFIERTGYVLIAKVENDDFYVIGIYKHGSGHEDLFSDPTLIQKCYDHWPHLIEPFVLRGLLGGDKFTPSERALLRKNNVTVPISLDNGLIIMSPGGGTTCAGTSTQNIMHHDKIMRSCKYYSEQLLKILKPRLDCSATFSVVSFWHDYLVLFSLERCVFLHSRLLLNNSVVNTLIASGFGPLYSHGWVPCDLNKVTLAFYQYHQPVTGMDFLCPFQSLVKINRIS